MHFPFHLFQFQCQHSLAKYKFWCSSLNTFLQSPVPSYILVPNIPLSTLFSDTLSKRSLLTLTDHISDTLSQRSVLTLTDHVSDTLSQHSVLTLTDHISDTLSQHSVLTLTDHISDTLSQCSVLTLTDHISDTLSQCSVLTLRDHVSNTHNTTGNIIGLYITVIIFFDRRWDKKTDSKPNHSNFLNLVCY